MTETGLSRAQRYRTKSWYLPTKRFCSFDFSAEGRGLKTILKTGEQNLPFPAAPKQKGRHSLCIGSNRPRQDYIDSTSRISKPRNNKNLFCLSSFKRRKIEQNKEGWVAVRAAAVGHRLSMGRKLQSKILWAWKMSFPKVRCRKMAVA